MKEKLLLDGTFDLHDAKFLKSTIQNQIDQLSRRGQGQPKNEEIDEVISRMQGIVPFGKPGDDFSIAGF